jgi:hypothetical protein
MTISEEQMRELAGIFDDIITSDSEAVKSAFHRLAFLSSLARQERDEPGPFTDIVQRLDWMEREMVEMKRDIQILQNDGQLDMINDINVDLGPFIKGLNGGSPSYQTMNSINIAPLTTSDIITLTSSQTDIFTSNIRIDLDGTT